MEIDDRIQEFSLLLLSSTTYIQKVLNSTMVNIYQITCKANAYT